MKHYKLILLISGIVLLVFLAFGLLEKDETSRLLHESELQDSSLVWLGGGISGGVILRNDLVIVFLPKGHDAGSDIFDFEKRSLHRILESNFRAPISDHREGESRKTEVEDFLNDFSGSLKVFLGTDVYEFAITRGVLSGE